MNESEFELHLRGLRPIRPSLELEQRIDHELAPLRNTRAEAGARETPAWWERLLPGLGWAAVGAAAAVITMLSLNLAKGGAEKKAAEPVASHPLPHPQDDADGARAHPTSSPQPAARNSVTANSVLDATDEGLWDGGAAGIGRRVRYSTLERRSWTEADGAVTVVEVPREDVVMVPVSFQ